MKISWNWLKSLAEFDDLTPREVHDKFTEHSAEMEGMESEGEYLSRVIMARIVGIRPHPDADKLHLVTVDTGSEKFEIVCGAPNVEINKVAVLAKLGTELPGGFKLIPKKIRGVLSEGMLCSERELGLSDSHEGIILLPENTEPGKTYAEILKKDDSIFEIDNKSLTHRPDCWGHFGIAREICAIFGKKLKNPYRVNEFQHGSQKVLIDNRIPEKCFRYCGIVISGLRVAESPEWMKKRLAAVGSRPINNIVDATNYVMLELGQPLHSFDRKKISGSTIVIRLSENGEKATTLDRQEITCTGAEILIADERNALALGGVMGLGNSEVDASTTEIILESATFDAATIRRTANRFNLRTDAAQRFEKSQDPENASRAIFRFFDLIRETCPDAAFSSPLADSYPGKRPTLTISSSFDYIRSALGTEITDDRISAILGSLEFKLQKDGTKFTASVPSFRATKDISQPIDLVEEVGRIHGYGNIAPLAPLVSMEVPYKDSFNSSLRKIREFLSFNLGLAEIYNYSFFNQEKAVLAGSPENALKMRNPLSQEADRLVTDLLPNMLESIRNNARFFDEFSFYEIGHVFTTDSESEVLIISLYRKKDDGNLALELKFLLEQLFTELKVAGRISVAEKAGFHPLRCGTVRCGKREFDFGEIHPDRLAKFGIKGRVAAVQLTLREMLELCKTTGKFKDIPKYPGVPFDLTLLIPMQQHLDRVISEIRKTSPELIESIEFGGFYQDDKFPPDKKSATFHLTFRSLERTLSGEEITKLQQDIMNKMNGLGFAIK
ncbi:MAG: phenylalanine--tRNA ligase subunit beta [Candidatus Wallbacteria bacterium]|nr:phenylalanine--tRNA ligase subunit beta [Candidatus Wallbacteria bacterium]